MAANYTLSTYSLATINLTVAASSATPTYIWSAAVPSGAKGKGAILQLFFNLYTATNFFAGQTFNYGIYVDGTPLVIGDSTTVQYIQTAAVAYAINSSGVSRGTNGFTGYNPLIIPVSFSETASQIQIGISNSTLPLSSISSANPHVTSNVTVASGTLNTANWVPINTFTTTGSNNYTVPTTVQGGTVQGVFIYCWGAGGQGSCNGGGRWTIGGGGGHVSGYYACAAGTVLTYVVGAIGTGVATSGGGSASGGSPGSQQGFNGGGFSGVFLSNAGGIVQSNAILIAGGGGSGGLYSTYFGAGGVGSGGGGGYPSGAAAYNYSTGVTSAIVLGGTQTAAGTGYANASGFIGGAGSSGYGGGGGGGGWYGGGGGSTASSGGAGGSSYLGTLLGASPSPSGLGPTALASYANGTTQTTYAPAPPGAITNPLYVSGRGYGDIDSGQGGTGLVVIIPAITANSVQIGVQASLFTL